MSTLSAVLMAGGSGTRFWPASRKHRPKQLLPIGTEVPLLQATSERLAALVPPGRQLVITSERYVDGVRELLPAVPPDHVVGEPEGRDTAACVGLAGRLLAQLDEDAIGIALPSDHVLSPVPDYLDHLAAAVEVLTEHRSSVLVFGVAPDRPATGYGYVRQGEKVGAWRGHDVHRLVAYIEKPDRARAEALLAEGGHLWNAGMFAFRPAALAEAYAAHLPEMGSHLDALAEAWRGPGFTAALAEHYPQLTRISIDFGVMEKLDDALVMPLPLRWDDVGAWDALPRLLPADEHGNVAQGETLALDAGGNILAAAGGLVAVKGVSDLIVVHTPDATMVCRKDDAEGVKAIVAALRERGWERYE